MIFVFKTNVSPDDLETLQPLLGKHLPDSKWNFDLDDCDNIFRIDSQLQIAETVIKLIQDNGYKFEELSD